MIKRVSTAEAEAHLSALMAEVAADETAIIIEQQGQPIAALVSITRLGYQSDNTIITAPAEDDMLALVGSWGDLGDDTIDEMVAQIYAARDQDQARAIDFPE